MAKSILDDAKKWPEFREQQDEEPHGIYKPLYVIAKAVEEAVREKLEPPPPPPEPPAARSKSYQSAIAEDRKLTQISLALQKADPSLATLLIYQEIWEPLNIVLLLTKCSFCGEKHRTTIKLIDYYRSANHGLDAIKTGIDALRMMCQIELGPAGIQK